MVQTSRPPAAQPPAQPLGLVSLTSLVVASMIGIGIFTSSGYSLATLGNPGRVLLAWIVCGVWALCGAISYGSLVSRLPMSGGEYLFLSRLVHPGVGFLAGWISLVAGFTAPISLAAKGAVVHALPGTSSSDWSVTWLAAALILVIGGCHAIGVRIGTRMQNAIVLVKLFILLGIIVLAFFGMARDDWQGGVLPDRNANWWPEDLSAWWVLLGSMSWVALSYTGFNAAVYAAGESPNASKLVPRAMILGTILVTLFYLVLNYIFVYAPEPSLLVDERGFGREEVATIAAQAIGGNWLASALRVSIVLAMVDSVFAMLMLGPRVYQQMAADGVMPKWIAGRSFRPAIALQCTLSVAVLFTGNILDLMTYLGLTLSMCSVLTVASLWWTTAGHARVPTGNSSLTNDANSTRQQVHSHSAIAAQNAYPMRNALTLIEHLSAGLYVAISLCFLVAASEQRPEQFWAMVATFGVGVLIYMLLSRKKVARAHD